MSDKTVIILCMIGLAITLIIAFSTGLGLVEGSLL